MATQSEAPKVYITFDRHDVEGRKTPVVFIRNIRSDIILGEIKWHGAWRQFVFFPRGNTIFNVDCMKSIMEKIAELMLERADKARAERG